MCPFLTNNFIIAEIDVVSKPKSNWLFFDVLQKVKSVGREYFVIVYTRQDTICASLKEMTYLEPKVHKKGQFSAFYVTMTQSTCSLYILNIAGEIR